MKKLHKITAAILVLVLAAAVVLYIRGPAEAPPQPDEPTTVTQAPTTEAPRSITFMAVGDNLIHKPIYNQAKRRAQGGAGYDFAPAYAQVKDKLAQADLSMINQETPLASAVAEVSSYPMFCSPTEVGDAVYDLGFRVVGLINNHSLDKGTKGVAASLDYWDSQPGLCHFGAYRDEADAAVPRTITVEGITFAFVGATYSYNGLRLPADSPLILPLLEDEARLQAMTEAARAAADVVVAAPHWGTENSTVVTEAQRELARKFVSWGADLVIGTHPHVLQTMEYMKKPDGGQAFVAYSLGNFFSGQNVAPNLIGGILELSITKDAAGITITAPKLHPLVTQYESGYSNVRLIPWTSYTQALGSTHGVRSYDSRMSYTWIETFLKEVIPAEYLA